MELDNIDYSKTFELLYEYADKFKQLYTQKIQENGHNATGNLLSQLSTDVTFNGTTFRVIANIPYYYEYLENGRKAGKMPPVEDIFRWVQAKNILPTSNNGKLPTQKSLAYAIAKSIGKKGTMKQYGYGGNGGQYMAKTVEELNEIYLPLIKESLDEDISNAIFKTFKSITNGKIKFQNL